MCVCVCVEKERESTRAESKTRDNGHRREMTQDCYVTKTEKNGSSSE